MQPGIYEMDNDTYHASPGISKSGLWTIHTKSPAHYKFGEPAGKAYFDVGQGAHDAILQPAIWEQKYYRGPNDRRGNKWKNAEEFCEHNSLTLLTEGDFDAVLKVRDAALAVPTLREIVEKGLVERAGFWIDRHTGVICRCKPDSYSPELKIILDLKSTTNAHIDEAARAIARMGYHVQEAFYTDGWPQAGGGDVEGWIFAFVEKKPPYAVAIYETHPNVVEEGRAIYRKALYQYAACAKVGAWPAYPLTVQQIDMARWAYRETAPREQD